MYIVDTEADSLTPSRFRVLVAKNAGTHRIIKAVGHDEIRRFFAEFSNCTYVFHNGISWDAYWLNRVVGCRLRLSHLVDTLVLSFLWHPSPPDGFGHSLEGWGRRVNYNKVQVKNNDFANATDEELLERCLGDVEITHRTWNYLRDIMLKIGYSEKSCELEHGIRFIIDEQQRYGFNFDIPGAESLYDTLRRRQQTLGEEIAILFPPRLKPVREYSRRFKQDGTESSNFLRHREQYPQLDLREDGSYLVWDWEEFNLASPKQRTERLLELGWIPQQFTKPSDSHPKGQPKVDEDSLIEAAERLKKPELMAIAEWLVTFGRANMVNTWLQNVNRDDSRIHGTVFTCGALSRRCRHSNPNTANIPSNKAKYGKECRSLWTASKGRILLGGDAKACQMRILGHYLNNPEITKMYLEGDPHQRNSDASGFVTRERMKNVFYAMIFGAQDNKLGVTAVPNGTRNDGRRAREAIYSTTPGLEEVTRDAQDEFKDNKGRLKCIDGGYVNCPSKHSALNYKIQPDEACLMKLTGIKVWKKAKKKGIDYHQTGFIHDEYQYDVKPKDADELGKIFLEATTEAGEELGFKVKMEGDFKVGKTWAETH